MAVKKLPYTSVMKKAEKVQTDHRGNHMVSNSQGVMLFLYESQVLYGWLFHHKADVSEQQV